MSKLASKERLEVYQKSKFGETISSLSIKYDINKVKIHYQIRLIDKYVHKNIYYK